MGRGGGKVQRCIDGGTAWDKGAEDDRFARDGPAIAAWVLTC